MAANRDLVTRAYESIGRTDIGSSPAQIDQEGFDYWINQLDSNVIAPQDFNNIFGSAVDQYMLEKQGDPIEDYVADYLVRSAYDDIGRSGIGADVGQIDQSGYDYWTNELKSGATAPSDLGRVFSSSVNEYIEQKPNDPYTGYVVKQLQSRTPATGGGPTGGGSGGYGNYLGGGSVSFATPGTPGMYRQTTGVGAAGDEMLDAGNASYQSPLIQALRNSSASPFSNNQGVTQYDYESGTPGAGKAAGKTAQNFSNNPQDLLPDVASADDVANWNNYSTYRTNSLNAKTPITSFEEWLAGGKVSGIPEPVAPQAWSYGANDGGGA